MYNLQQFSKEIAEIRARAVFTDEEVSRLYEIKELCEASIKAKKRQHLRLVK